MSQEREEFMTKGTWGRTHLLTVLLVSVLGPASAWGQVLTLTPSLTVGETYDDNIFQEADDEVDDFITTISPAIQLHYQPRTETDLTFEYQPSFQIFAQNDDQNHVSHLLNLDFESPLSRRFALKVSDELEITEEPNDRIREVDDISDNPDERPQSTQDRERTVRNTAVASFDVGLTPRTSLGLLFENLYEDVDDEDELDEVRYSLGANLGYLTDVARQNRASLGYSATLFTFSNNCEAGDTGCNAQNDESFTVHSLYAEYAHNLSATLSAQAKIGYATTVSDRDDIDGNDGFVGSVGFVKTLRTGQFDLNYERSFTSGGGTSDQVISDRIFGRLRFQPTPKITAALSGTIAILDYQQDNVSPVNDDDRNFFLIRPSIEYQALRYLGFNAAYTFGYANYQEGERADRTDHRLLLGAVMTIRAGLFVNLTYEYRYRDYDNTIEDDRSSDEFSRNEILLSLTYQPTFRF
jgi:hypothetical protein